MRSKKLKGYTLVEMLFVLILSGIVAGICGYAYLIVKKQELLFFNKSDRSTETALVTKRITELAYRSDIVLLNDNELVFCGEEILGKVKFTEDSLHLLTAANESFAGISFRKYAIDTIRLSDDHYVVKGFNIYLKDMDYPLIFNKDIDASVFVNNDLLKQ